MARSQRAGSGHDGGKAVALLLLLGAVGALAYARRDREAAAGHAGRAGGSGTSREERPGLELRVDVSTSTRRTTVAASGTPTLVAALSARPEAPAPSGSADAPLYASGDLAYAEPIDCRGMPSTDAIREAHAPAGTRATAEALARLRYPDGLPFLQTQTDDVLKTWFSGAPDTFAGVAGRFEAAVHEGSHVWGSKTFRGRARSYSVRGDLTIGTQLPKTFDRSEILQKHVDRAGDPYAKTYLEGSSGAQGFDTVLDEYVAYTHGLAARWCTRDLVPEGTRMSARDGVLAFMYYVETYLEIARTAHPADYAAIVGDAGARRVVVSNWDRAELFLRASAGERALGIADERIRAWVYEPARLAEIERVRAASKAGATGAK